MPRNSIIVIMLQPSIPLADAATADGHYWIIAIVLVVLVVLMIGIAVTLIAVRFHHKRKTNSTEHSTALDEFAAEGLNDNGYR